VRLPIPPPGHFRSERDCIKHFSSPSGLLEEFLGTVQGHRDGHGFVSRDDGEADLYLPINEMRAVMHKDRVKATITRLDRRGRPEGKIVEIVDRATQPIIGRLLHAAGVWFVVPEDRRYGRDIVLSKGGEGLAKADQIVVIELIDPPALYGHPTGRVVEVLGEFDDPGMEIEIAVRKYGVPHEFSPSCVAALAAIPGKVRPIDLRQRVDLRDVPLITIDGEDARDFDDAVYCESTQIGRNPGWRLLVAIADVSHYVVSGGDIDVDAYERATSVYFPRRVIPMLPEKLSNGLCSLNPDVDRLCMVCDMLIDADGLISAYQFYPAVMHSHARFTYTEVAAILANTRGSEASKRASRVGELERLHEVFQALLKSRRRRGAVDFETTETQIVCDAVGHIEKIMLRTRNDAHRMIEEAMLAANVCSAEFLRANNKPAVYRVHDGPAADRVEVLRTYLKAMGVQAILSDRPTTMEFQRIAELTRERSDAKQIHTMLLRSMQQAIYSPHNVGHFGLAYDAYTHFTSPIRRYPDLLVHRVIKSILSGKPYHLPVLPQPGEAHERLARRLAKKKTAQGAAVERKKPIKVSKELLGWEAAGLHCSANERRADEASRDVEAWLKCRYMQEHLGEKFFGQVSTVTSFGLFVVLDSMYVEGLVHITELGGEYFRFDEARQEMRGERTGTRYAIGTRVHVQVSRVELDARKIDFRLITDDEMVHQSGVRLSGGAREKKIDAVAFALRTSERDVKNSVAWPDETPLHVAPKAKGRKQGVDSAKSPLDSGLAKRRRKHTGPKT
jgi:ribonuclease R